MPGENRVRFDGAGDFLQGLLVQLLGIAFPAEHPKKVKPARLSPIQGGAVWNPINADPTRTHASRGRRPHQTMNPRIARHGEMVTWGEEAGEWTPKGPPPKKLRPATGLRRRPPNPQRLLLPYCRTAITAITAKTDTTSATSTSTASTAITASTSGKCATSHNYESCFNIRFGFHDSSSCWCKRTSIATAFFTSLASTFSSWTCRRS